MHKILGLKLVQQENEMKKLLIGLLALGSCISAFAESGLGANSDYCRNNNIRALRSANGLAVELEMSSSLGDELFDGELVRYNTNEYKIREKLNQGQKLSRMIEEYCRN